MKRSLLLFSLIIFVFILTAEAQTKRRPPAPNKKNVTAQKSSENTTAIVVDERLAVLRIEPSLYARPIQRMRRGRLVSISGSRQADGVTFFRVNVPPRNYGWVQAEAVTTKSKRGEDERLAKLVQASEGFEQIERAMLFLETFPNSALRPAILLLLGDLIEENAAKISNEATRRLDKREMAATGAPLHSFYLNYTSLDRYRRLGVNFVFNSNTKTFHYDGAAWKEIVSKFPASSEAAESQKRLGSLKEKMERIK
jgi:choline dehydrogenase-like flavoprotein